MSLKEIITQQQKGLEYMASYGVMGLHLVSGPLVGVAMGFGIDYLLGTNPWGKLIFLFVGIAAGFLNVYRDAQRILAKINKDDARRRGDAPNESAAAPAKVTARHDASTMSTNAADATSAVAMPEMLDMPRMVETLKTSDASNTIGANDTVDANDTVGANDAISAANTIADTRHSLHDR